LKSLKAEIIEFVQGQYRQTGKVPSVGEICQQLQRMGLNRTVFYTVFPHGIMQVCENSGVPLPRGRVQRTFKARKTRENIKGRSPNEDREYERLKQKESALKTQAEDIRKKAEIRNRIKQLASELARTPEGRKKIFSDPKLFQEYCETLLPATLAELRTFCSERRQSFEKTLLSMQKLCSLNYRLWRHNPLNDYVIETVNEFIEDARKEEKRNELQSIFNRSLASAKCHNCSQPISSEPFHLDEKHVERAIMVVEGLISCWHCSSHYRLLCPICLTQLEYQGELDFHCSKCDVVYFMQGSDPDKRFAVKVPIHMNFTR
jgi:hypothetical protein